MVVFGGVRGSGEEWYSDVWYFDLATKAWAKEEGCNGAGAEDTARGARPSARAGHAAAHLTPRDAGPTSADASGGSTRSGSSAGAAADTDAGAVGEERETEATDANKPAPYADVGTMIVFGGCDSDGVLLNDLWTFEYASAAWHCASSAARRAGGAGGDDSRRGASVSGTAPTAREGAAMVVANEGAGEASTDGGDVYLYGGAGSGGQCLDDLYCLRTRSSGSKGETPQQQAWTWQRVDFGGSVGPGRRFLHTMCAVNGQLHVWGGASASSSTGGGRRQEAVDTGSICDTVLFSFNVAENTWSRSAAPSSSPDPPLPPGGAAPPPTSIVQRRCGHSCTVVSGGAALLFFGGLAVNGSVSNDLVLCKLATRHAARPVWSKLAVTGGAPALEPRFGHAACFHKRSGQVLFFGGETASDTLGSVAVVRVDEQPRAALFVAFIAILVVAYFLFIYCKVTGVLGEGQTRLT